MSAGLVAPTSRVTSILPCSAAGRARRWPKRDRGKRSAGRGPAPPEGSRCRTLLPSQQPPIDKPRVQWYLVSASAPRRLWHGLTAGQMKGRKYELDLLLLDPRNYTMHISQNLRFGLEFEGRTVVMTSTKDSTRASVVVDALERGPTDVEVNTAQHRHRPHPHATPTRHAHTPHPHTPPTRTKC